MPNCMVLLEYTISEVRMCQHCSTSENQSLVMLGPVCVGSSEDCIYCTFIARTARVQYGVQRGGGSKTMVQFSGK